LEKNQELVKDVSKAVTSIKAKATKLLTERSKSRQKLQNEEVGISSHRNLHKDNDGMILSSEKDGE